MADERPARHRWIVETWRRRDDHDRHGEASTTIYFDEANARAHARTAAATLRGAHAARVRLIPEQRRVWTVHEQRRTRWQAGNWETVRDNVGRSMVESWAYDHGTVTAAPANEQIALQV